MIKSKKLSKADYENSKITIKTNKKLQHELKKLLWLKEVLTLNQKILKI